MKYYKGDIVEIITARYKSWNDIPAHERGYYLNCKEPAPTIGQRFRVAYVPDEHSGQLCAQINGGICLCVYPDCVILIRRSLFNKIRSFLEI